SMNFSAGFTIYTWVETDNGKRYIIYNASDTDGGYSDSGTPSVTIGLGSDAVDGTWHTYNRDLQADLELYEPGNNIVLVEAFMIRGTGLLDDIKISSGDAPANPGTLVVTPSTINFSNVYVDSTGSTEVFITNTGGSILTIDSIIVSEDLSINETFPFYIEPGDTTGILVYFIPSVEGYYSGNLTVYGRGSPSQSTTVDVSGIGVSAAQNDSSVVIEDSEDGSIEGWSVYAGSGTITNVFDTELLSNVISLVGDNGSLTDGFKITNTDGSPWDQSKNKLSFKYNAAANYTIYIWIETDAGKRYLCYEPKDVDGGLKNWGTITICLGLGGGTTDGIWRTITRNLQDDLALYEPGVTIQKVQSMMVRGGGKIDDISLSYVEPDYSLVIEDGEDGNTDGWSNYTGGGTITNIFDTGRQSNVIDLSGINGDTNDGFALNYDSIAVFNSDIIKWSMQFSDDFVIYFKVITSTGIQKYLYYTPEETDREVAVWGGTEYVHHGLGTNSGTWTDYQRYLPDDLPGETITNIIKISVRGDGRIDDIVFDTSSPGLSKSSFINGGGLLKKNAELDEDTFNPYTDEVNSSNNDKLAGIVPESFELMQNYPNPFNMTTKIRFGLPTAGHVKIVIYNIRGQKVKELVSSDFNPGYHIVSWDGRNDAGIVVSSGVYLLRIKAVNFMSVKKMTVIK
ncbi:MAG: T9SS type A sorting domain-containing protein, partial [bacterium]|nr:T9SS type A sorting domain-containing protein [bacterium]